MNGTAISRAWGAFMVAKLALSKLCICAAGGALIGGAAVHVVEKPKAGHKPRIHRVARSPEPAAEALPCEPIMVQQAGLTVAAPALTSPMGAAQAPIAMTLPSAFATRSPIAARVPSTGPGDGLSPADPGSPVMPGDQLQPMPPKSPIRVAEPMATAFIGLGALGAVAARRRHLS